MSGANLPSRKSLTFWVSALIRPHRVIAMPLPSCARHCVSRRIAVPIRDEEQFECYLKEFRPLPPGSPYDAKYRLGPRRSSLLMVWAAIIATILIAAVLVVHSRHRLPQAPGGSGNLAGPG